MNNDILILLESILGAGKPQKNGNVLFFCPSCNHYKRKLIVNINTNSEKFQKWHCWVCESTHNMRGNSIYFLLKKVNASADQLRKVNTLTKQKYRNTPSTDIKMPDIRLPDEFIPLYEPNSSNILYQHAKVYLTQVRNISNDDILKYKIGYCESGLLRNYIIFPSYDANGKLNYYYGRKFRESYGMTHYLPQISKDVIGFELFINWNYPIVITEGAIDAISIRRNSIPIFGKSIQNKLKSQLLKSDEIYVSLDSDAILNTLKICEYLLNQNKAVYLVELPNNTDPNDLGFDAYWKLVRNIPKLTQSSLIKYKLKYNKVRKGTRKWNRPNYSQIL